MEPMLRSARRVAERPTTRPPFDPAQFAQEAESRLRSHSACRIPASYTTRFSAAIARSCFAGQDERGVRTRATRARNGGARRGAAPGHVPTRAREWFALSPAASRLIAQVDGVAHVDAVCSQAGLPRTEGTLILLELSDQGIVTFR